MKKNSAKRLLIKTKDNYNLIAGEFSSKREHLTPDILYFKKYINNDQKILDCGCGNGRLIKMFSALKINYTGSDNSKNMLKIAKKKFPKNNFILADVLKLPFKNEQFDRVFSLAVIHHVAGLENQKKFVSETFRVLKNGGLAIITTWKLNNKQVLKSKKINKSGNEVFVPFSSSSGEKLVDRYVYLFEKEEIEKLFQNQGFKIIESGINKRGKSRNIYLVVKK